MKYILILVYVYGGPSMIAVPGDYYTKPDCELAGYAALRLLTDDHHEDLAKFVCIPAK